MNRLRAWIRCALHQFHAHLPGQETVLEVGRVVDAGREHHDVRVAGLRGRDVLEHRPQLLRIVFDGADPLPFEELRKDPLHDLAILEHVGHAGGCPQVVLEHVHHAVAAANEVGAGDVAPHAAGRLEAGARSAEALARIDQPIGHHAVGHDPAPVVDVVDEQVEGVDPLLQPALDGRPLGRVDDPRHDVERPDLLRPGLVAVDVERDPHREQRLVGRPLPRGELTAGKRGQPPHELLGAGPWPEPVVEELVVETVGLVRLQVHAAGTKEEGTPRRPGRLQGSRG